MPIDRNPWIGGPGICQTKSHCVRFWWKLGTAKAAQKKEVHGISQEHAGTHLISNVNPGLINPVYGCDYLGAYHPATAITIYHLCRETGGYKLEVDPLMFGAQCDPGEVGRAEWAKDENLRATLWWLHIAIGYSYRKSPCLKMFDGLIGKSSNSIGHFP